MNKFTSINQIRKKYPRVFNYLCKRYGREEAIRLCCKRYGLTFIKSNKERIKWTDEMLMADAAQYKTRTEWANKSPSAYQSARSRGIIDKCCKHMTAHNETWTEEKLMIEASKYKTRYEWQKKSNGAYIAARRRDILDKCCKHMVCGKKLRWAK